MNFAIVGLGFISDRHIESINKVGGKLIMACDIDEEKKYKCGNAKFFTDFNKMVKHRLFKKVDYVAICTPNYLHLSQAKECVLRGKKVICEKPPIISVEGFGMLTQNDVDNLYLVFQCRYAKELLKIKRSIKPNKQYEAAMSVQVHRGDWYKKSWKGDSTKSGGLFYNIGCHYFDLLCWFFGKPTECFANTGNDGIIYFKNASVRWFLSTDAPMDKQQRILKINGKNYNLTQMGFESLHPTVYKEILKGKGYKIDDFKPTLDLIENLYESINEK